MKGWIGGAAALLLAGFAGGSAGAQPGDYRDWAAVVVAADYRDGAGRPIENFDNARRDMVQALTRAGFDPANIAQLSSARSGPGVGSTTVAEFVRASQAVTGRARSGCLFYFTSHGSPQGMVFGREGVMSPEMLAQGIDQWCSGRPTVVVVSACFSGVFVPILESDERMVLTAARPDRSSFGCSSGSRYPYFDECVLQSMPRSRDFPSMGAAAQACVARREQAERLSPASEPQMSVGARVRPMLTRLTFADAAEAPATTAANDNVKPPADDEGYDDPAWAEKPSEALGKP